MKSTLATVLIASLLSANVCLGDAIHEADRGLEGSLRAAINERHVHVRVHHGIVTLDGKVPTEADRQRVEALVRNTSGVAAVNDKLKVSVPEPGVYGPKPTGVPVFATPPPVVTPPITTATPVAPIATPDFPKLVVQPLTTEDEPIANDIAKQLRVEALPPSGLEKVNITIVNGQVTLKGNVNSQADHDALIRSIKRALGVNAIYDQTQVIPPEASGF